MTERHHLCVRSAAKHHEVTLYCDASVECPDISGVYTQKLDVAIAVLGTPLQRWYATVDLSSEGSYRAIHLSDAVRLTLLWHHGGIYLDTDMLVLSSLQGLPKNALGEENYGGSHQVVSNAALAFEAKHPFIWACMQELANRFVKFEQQSFGVLLQSGLWGQNGPKLLQRVLGRWPRSNGTVVMASGSNPGTTSVTVLPTSTFYHIPPNQILDYFKVGTTATQLVGELNKHGAVAIHLWNQISRVHEPAQGSAVYTLLHDASAFTT